QALERQGALGGGLEGPHVTALEHPAPAVPGGGGRVDAPHELAVAELLQRDVLHAAPRDVVEPDVEDAAAPAQVGHVRALAGVLEPLVLDPLHEDPVALAVRAW